MELKIPKRARTRQKKPAVGSSKVAGGTRFVLFLGDEGAILTHIKGNVVLSRQFIPDASQDNLREFQQTLYKDPAAPLYLVVDNMDQSYVQQTLPPVSSFGVGKLIKRRLERDFSANDIKGAILLGREKTGRKDWNFLMVALEKSPQLKVWLDFIQELPNRFVGIYLVSVEAELILKRLEKGMGLSVEETGVEWKFFVSHNKVGGFRQVILRNGRIIFTRLAQPVGESTPEVIAGNIEQEMLSTIEYMKRLAFTPQSKLAIYIIASSAIKAAIDPAKFSASSFHIFTPYEISQHLGIEGAAQPTDQFGDVVLAATIGGSRKHVLTLSAPQTRRIDQYYQFIIYQRLGAVLATFFIFCACVFIGRDIYRLSEEAAALASDQASQQRALDDLRNRIKQSNIDVEKASDLFDMYRQLQAEKLSPLPLLKKLEPIVNSPVWIKSVEWDSIAGSRLNRAQIMQTRNPGAGVPAASESHMLTTVMLEFPQQASDSRIFKVVSKRVLSDFRNIFKGYDVRYTSVPDEVAESEQMQITASAGKQEDTASKSLDVQLAIRGNLADFQAEHKIKDPFVEDALTREGGAPSGAP